MGVRLAIVSRLFALVPAAKMVLGAALIMTLVAIASSTLPARITQAGPNCDADTTIDPQEEALFNLINDYRADNGVDPLVFSDTLNQAAAWKSEHMADNDYFGHEDAGIGRDLFGRLVDCGYPANTSVTENIAAGHDTAAATFEPWRMSPAHNSTMLDPDKVAIGIARAFDAESEFGWYWTTDFGGVADGFTSPAPEDLPNETGDTNCDGVVDSLDAALILQLSAGLLPALPCPGGGDTNGDGITNALDAALVLQFSAGLISVLPP